MDCNTEKNLTNLKKSIRIDLTHHYCHSFISHRRLLIAVVPRSSFAALRSSWCCARYSVTRYRANVGRIIGRVPIKLMRRSCRQRRRSAKREAPYSTVRPIRECRGLGCVTTPVNKIPPLENKQRLPLIETLLLL